MIHQLLALTRPLYVLDTETTGTDAQFDRIVEIGFQRWTAEGMNLEWRSLVNPGVPIPAAATAVHGITDERMMLCNKCGRSGILHPYHVLPDALQGMEGLPRMSAEVEAMNDGCPAFKPMPIFAQLAPHLIKGFHDCDYAGKHIRFDLRLMDVEFRRAGVPWSYLGARIIDIDRLEQIAVPRDLASMHEKYAGQKHDDAHGALADVRASATVIAKQLETHQTLPRDLDALHALQWPGMLDLDGKFRMIHGVPTCMFGKYRNKPMREIPQDYWDWILKAEFPADVQALANDAKLGKFPGDIK